MKFKLLKQLMFFGVMLCSSVMLAQTVTGTVTSNDGPLPGVSVVVNLIASDGEKLNIINGTYWYNESQYGFNKFYRLNGVWDEPLELAIEKIRTLEIDKLNSDLSRWISKLETFQQKESDTKSKFESEFI